ncbi:hypothetical protein DAD186_00880 [Dermabacter vaginalis]|uniref:Uncharacterized protein n=1 Tax=Dermabacter vaginalis TaxID=1630135 RepID=A0A1B0ZFD5_9MICO|nr:hypothetical protein [Dermabacter vaginalis]ANP26647.1 hypothetical protein DAD186_00880 [Dermabacter vaginalis]
MVDLANDSLGDASSTLQHSPLSSTAAQKCLEFFILHDIEYCQGLSRKNVESVKEAVDKYVYGDGLIAEFNSAGEASIHTPDAPGSGNRNPNVVHSADEIARLDAAKRQQGSLCTPDNPTGKGIVTKNVPDLDPMTTPLGD